MAGIDAGGIYSTLSLKTGDFFTAIKRAQDETQGLESKLQNMSQKATATGKTMTAKLSVPIAGVATAATVLGMNFDSSMSEVQAISGATGADMEKLEKIARDMGATTKFSARDAADGLKYMAMAGWETEEMMDGLPGVLSLAAASGEDLGTTSDIVTDALTAFGLKAKDSAAFADLLASASSNSNTNVGIMGETFKYVAPLFGALGYSAEDAALATGLMANAGIKGSQAGTTLRSAVTRLVKPTKESAGVMKELGISITDANGEMKPFGAVMEELRGKFKHLSKDQQAQAAASLFGQEAMSGMLAIINATEEDFNKLTKATTEYDGAAKKMADTMEDNLKGRTNNLKSALEEAGISIYKTLLPSLEKLVEWLQAGADWFNEAGEGTQKLIIGIAGTAAAIGPALLVFGALSGAVVKVSAAAKLLSGGMAAVKGATTAATAPSWALGGAMEAGTVAMGPWVLGAAAVAGGAYLIHKRLKEDAIPEVERFGKEVSDSTQEAVGGFMDMTEQADIQLKELSWSQQHVTSEMAEDMRTKQQEITTTLLTAIGERHKEEIEETEQQLKHLNTMDGEQKNKIIESINDRYEIEKMTTENGHEKINEIIDKAHQEGRKIYDHEAKEILQIRENMTEQSVKMMSQNEVEQKVILENMKGNSSTITAKEAAEVVKNSKKKKEDVIKEANEQHDETVAWAIRQRDELGTLTDEEAADVIEAARKQRDESVSAAEDKHRDIVKEAKAQAGEHVNLVDWETGEIKSKYAAMKTTVATKAKEMKEAVTKWAKEKAEGFRTSVESMKTKIDEWKTKADEMKTTAKTKFKSVKQSASDNFTNVKKAIQGGIGKIREWNNTNFKNKTATAKTTIIQTFKTIGQRLTGAGNNAHGTEHWKGGLTWVGEQGRELIDLPQGTSIYSNQKSETMAKGNRDPIDITLKVPVVLEGREVAKATAVFTAEELDRIIDDRRRGGR